MSNTNEAGKTAEDEISVLIKTEQDRIKPEHFQYDYQYSGELKAVEYYIKLGYSQATQQSAAKDIEIQQLRAALEHIDENYCSMDDPHTYALHKIIRTALKPTEQ